MKSIQYVQDVIIFLKDMNVITDSDVAELYGVKTRDVNKAVKNNPDNFPKGYIYELSIEEKNELAENFHRFERLKHTTVNPKAFSEKGLYMLTTIIKSKKATGTTIGIIETYAKIRELSKMLSSISEMSNDSDQKKIMKKSGTIITELLENNLKTMRQKPLLN